jgi:hypothetical protein
LPPTPSGIRPAAPTTDHRDPQRLRDIYRRLGPDRPDGRLILPLRLRLRGTNSRNIAFHRAVDGWRSLDNQQTVFMPLRGLGDDARRVVPLTAETDVTLQVHKDQTLNGDALTGVGEAMDPVGPTVRRFPLVPRPRPECTPLDTRVGELRALADTAQRTRDRATASAVFNQAALLASDLGLPDLARDWCHRHAELHLRTHALTAKAARHALEPLVNLARLLIRAGDGESAARLLDGLYQSVRARTDVVLDDIAVPAATLTATVDDHAKLCQWFWTVLLADGVRARTTAGRWHDALAFLHRHKGIGQRMFDGRQVAVIASAITGNWGDAHGLLNATACSERWETAVRDCLTVLCRHPENPVTPATATAMLDHCGQLDHRTMPIAFRARLYLTALDAASDVNDVDPRPSTRALIHQVLVAADGYAARDVLRAPSARNFLNAREAHDLTELVDTCGLDSGAIPPRLRTDLFTALDTSTAVLTGTIAISLHP